MSFTIPNNVSLSKIRGLIKVVKQNRGSILISELSDEAEEEIDDLIPIINMSRFLNLIYIKKDKIKLTNLGNKLNYKDYINLIKNRIKQAEPIKSVLEFLISGPVSTDEIIINLNKKGIRTYDENNKIELEELLIDLAVITKLIIYNAKKDEWRIFKVSNNFN